MDRSRRRLCETISRSCQPKEICHVLNKNWELKRQLADTISTTQIDKWYNAAIDAGAYGGKLCGAGGGGFLLFVVDSAKRQKVLDVLKELTPVKVGYATHGSQIIIGHEK